MQIVVTGGCGFVGSNLVRTLLQKNYEVLVIDNLSAGNKVVHKGAVYVFDDCSNIEHICKMHEFVPSYVYHLGEFSRIARSFERPHEVIHKNTHGTQCVVDYCLMNKAKLIYSGSSAIFGDDRGARSPYAYSKQANVDLINNYGKWFTLDYVICYFYNVFGDGEIQSGTHATVVGIFNKQYSEKKPLTVVSPGTQTRVFTHVDDIVAGLVLSAENGYGDGYHLSGMCEHSIEEVAQMFQCNYTYVPERPGERGASAQMSSKAKDELKWCATKKLSDYIASKTRKFTIGIVGFGFVGQANALLQCERVDLMVYDVVRDKCMPKDIKLQDLSVCDVIFIAVPTPKVADGSCCTVFVENVVNDIRNTIGYSVPLCVRSTVPIGFCEGYECHFMPEFLTEKHWRTDFINTPVWYVGLAYEDEEFKETMTQLFAASKACSAIKSDTIEFCKSAEAEMLKYMKNTFLATKVAFCNEMYTFCKASNIDYNTVQHMFGEDHRIGSSHCAVPGHDGKRGYGGTCFPKDVHALISQFKAMGVSPSVLEAATYRNENIDRPEKDWEQDKNRAVV